MLMRLPADPRTHDAARWGRENCILWGRVRQADFGPCTHTLSIRAAWGGVEHCHLDGRTVGVDDDNFLILDHGRIYSTSIHSAQPVESLAICFSPRLVEQLHFQGQSSQFLEHLRPHDAAVSPVLLCIRQALAQGCEDEAWYDEQLIILLARMRAHQEQLLDRVDRLALIRAATRREVYRRVARATDLLHSNYANGVDLTALAQTANLSKYHFLRLFKLVHGLTPHTYLQRKRIGVAVRLLESTSLTVREVAMNVGFADDSTLVRQMRRWTRHTPGQVRAGAVTTLPENYSQHQRVAQSTQ
ncbi:MAG: helix-turn-helix domain-containing protein [Steroidobacteraceae bacterium]